MTINIALIEPEIPQNTGNIARTCAATGAMLHLVKPLGFSLNDKYLKRAGLDYWENVHIKIYDNLECFFQKNSAKNNFFYVSTKAQKTYTEIEIPDNSFFLFGKETKGLPENLLIENYQNCVRIPMLHNSRSLNLSNSVAIIIYEALRQHNFKGLETNGKPEHFIV
jgi:tRNA (cytidine/uridine-2'-O-)-methyltransferase